MWATVTIMPAILLAMVIQSACQDGLLEAIMHVVLEGEQRMSEEIPSRTNILLAYDFIIVGAGTAGCALANRLTENPDWKVLLIEAGRSENLIMDYPLLTNYLQFTEANWDYRTEPSNTSCMGLENNQCKFPRGKVMGGSSVLNYMIHTRGHRKDYDHWRDLGNEGWGYDDVLPYFMKSEKFLIEEYGWDTKYHSKTGNVPVTYPNYHTKIAENILKGAEELKLPLVDINGPTMVGYSYLQTNIENGTRVSSNRAYINPIRKRQNLHVKKMSEVTRVLVDRNTKQTIGVEFLNFGRLYRVRANKEVILSAGAINSPKILMLSGIGPKKVLRKHGIPILANLRVGYNLMDHIALGGLTFLIDKPYSLSLNRILSNQSALARYMLYHEGPISVPGGCEVIAFYDLKRPNDTDGHPDLELLFQGGSLISDPVLRKNFGVKTDVYDTVFKPIENVESWMVWPMIMLPKSRGRIVLRDNNPRSKPLIFPNYLAHKEDVEVAVQGVQKVLELIETPAMKSMGTKLHDIPLPGCKEHKFGSSDYWECQIRHLTFTVYHYSGTAKMGPKTDRTAVVDPRLRVYGIKGLRVIDASIMPEIPSAHTNAPTYMIAERAADLIKEDWGFPTESHS